MDLSTSHLLFIAAGYLFGSISTAIVVARVMGLPDPRTEGSGNPGATNMLRVGGKRAAAITLAGDALKGVIPVLAARLSGLPLEVLALVGLAAFLGHLYPLFFGFRGGKGVATALGVFLAAWWPLGLALVATWLLVAKLFHISSLAALTAFALAPLYTWLMELPPLFVAVVVTVSALLFWRHRENIRRLLRGEET